MESGCNSVEGVLPVSSNQARGNGMLSCRLEFFQQLHELVMNLIEGKEVNFDPRVRSEELTWTLQELGLDTEDSGESSAGPLPHADPGGTSGCTCPPTPSLMEGCPDLAYTPEVIRIFHHLSRATSLPELRLDDPETAALLDCHHSSPATGKPASGQAPQHTKAPRKPRTSHPRAPRSSSSCKKLPEGEKAPRKTGIAKKSTKSMRRSQTVEMVLPRQPVGSKESVAVAEARTQQASGLRECLSPSYGLAAGQSLFATSSGAAAFPECESVPGSQPMVLTNSGLIVQLYSFCQVTDGKAE